MASTSKNPHAGFRDGDVWLRARLDDAVQLSEAHSCPRFVGFLDERQRAMAQAQLKAARGVNVSFYGGHDEAERTLCGIFPDFMEPEPALFPLTALAFRFRAEAGLTHRDFLGALMNLGIERAMIGDIVVKDLDGYVMVLKKISRYVLENLDTVGRTAVEAAVWEGAEELLEPEYEEVAGTVSSVRLDAIVALCGRVSRTKAAGLIAGEKVFINGQAVLSPSRQMEPGEILSIRGVGKFLFSRNGGQTKKGRISVTFLKYR